MFKTEARTAAEAAIRAARETGDAETITKALAEYNKLCEKEDRIRARRTRQRKRREAAKPATPRNDDNEEFDFTPMPAGEITPEGAAVREIVETPFGEVKLDPAPQEPEPEPDTQVLDCGSFPIPFGGANGRPGCGPHLGDFGRMLIDCGPEQIISHRFSGGEWDEERLRNEEAERDAYWRERMAKLYGR